MTILFFLALVIYVLVCVVLVTLILMQEGKGGGLSGVMGSSMGETFGFGGASKQIRKYTAVCAGVFLVLTIILTFLAESALRNTTSQFLAGGAGPAAVTPAAGTAPAPAPGTAPATATGEAPTPGQVPPAPATGEAPQEAPVAPAPAVPAPAE